MSHKRRRGCEEVEETTKRVYTTRSHNERSGSSKSSEKHRGPSRGHRRHHHRHQDRNRSCSKEPREDYTKYDDPEGHYIIRLGEDLTSRYKILSEMGEGTFGKVVECWDRDARQRVAIKIIRAIEKYRDAAMVEIEILEKLKQRDPKGEYSCVDMLTSFDFRGHVCMVFTKYGWSLFDFMKYNSYRGFSIDLIRKFAFQLLRSVAFLHSLTLVHTDLKPENVLLVRSDYTQAVPDGSADHGTGPSSITPVHSEIKLIDFGSATWESHYHTTIVSTRHYRAPEVVLGMGWSYPCDIWSVGCILIELYTGDALFHTHDNLEHLAMMEHVLGTFPKNVVQRADHHAQKYFTKDGKLAWRQKASSTSLAQVDCMKSLEGVLENEKPGHDTFCDLVRLLLDYDPETRISAADALKHPFFRDIDATRSNQKEHAARSLAYEGTCEQRQRLADSRHNNQHHRTQGAITNC